MDSIRPVVSLVIAEDNPDDRLLIKEAWQAAGLPQLYLVEDGEELLDFLYQRGKYAQHPPFPTPALILLDLRMPKKDGYEVLQEIKANPELKKIPVVVLTTSTSESDISRSYDLGACSYLTKPDTFEQLVELIQVLHKYWFETVTLPDC